MLYQKYFFFKLGIEQQAFSFLFMTMKTWIFEQKQVILKTDITWITWLFKLLSYVWKYFDLTSKIKLTGVTNF